jgi:hypothetical protein
MMESRRGGNLARALPSPDLGRPVLATPFIWVAPESIPPRKWLFGRHAIRQFLSATIAAGGAGKTSNALAEAVAFVTGRDILKDHLITSGRSWYIGLEDPLEEYQRRVAAIVLHHGLTPTEVAAGLFLDSGRDQDFIIGREGRSGIIIADPLVESIVQCIRTNNIAHVTIDPFVACHAVRENDNSAIDAVARVWADIADRTGAAIELVHHVRKLAPGQEMTADDARGASAMVGKARSVRLVTGMTKEEGRAGRRGRPAKVLPPGQWQGQLGAAVGKAHLASTCLGLARQRSGRPRRLCAGGRTMDLARRLRWVDQHRPATRAGPHRGRRVPSQSTSQRLGWLCCGRSPAPGYRHQGRQAQGQALARHLGQDRCAPAGKAT